MDETPQNGPGIQQEPAAENKYDYQQYLGPDSGPPKDRRKLIILVLAGLFAVLITALAVVLLSSNKNKSGQSGDTQTQVTTICQDESCLEQNFAQCLPAEYTFDEAGGSIFKYTVTGIQDVGCDVKMEYVTSKYSPEYVGKDMTCEFDNRLDFRSAVRNVVNFPQDYDCSGDLLPLFQAADNGSG
jgi:hypothetical protein